MAKKSSSGTPDIVGFIGQVNHELRQVTWPSREEAINMTLIVVGVSIVVSIYLGALDYLFIKITGLIIQ